MTNVTNYKINQLFLTSEFMYEAVAYVFKMTASVQTLGQSIAKQTSVHKYPPLFKRLPNATLL